MAKIIVFQHVPYEPLGTMNPLFKRQGMRIKYVNFGRDPHSVPSICGYDGIVILGGPMNVDQIDAFPNLALEVQLIQQAIDLDIPILGICLGAQLIAKALGAKVSKNSCKEIGWYDVSVSSEGREDALLNFFDGTEKIFQWHGDTFELPADATLLATGDSCANQAYRYKNNVYGFQFHLEVDKGLIERWLSVPAHIEELAALKGDIDPHEIVKQTPEYLVRSEQLSEQVFGAFSDLIGHKASKKPFESR